MRTYDVLASVLDAAHAAAVDLLSIGGGSLVAVFTSWGFTLFAVLAITGLALAGDRDRRRVGLVMGVGGLSSLVAAGIGLLVKGHFAEHRPCQLVASAARWSRCPDSASFPSNHSVFAGALASTAIVVARLVHRRWIAAPAVVLALAIGASRVILGVHYWWDVAAGLVWGAMVATAALYSTRQLRTRPHEGEPHGVRVRHS